MADIINISDHQDYNRKDSKSDELFYLISHTVNVLCRERDITPTEAVGVLEWVKASIILTNTEVREP
jgi:hypothetical protein